MFNSKAIKPKKSKLETVITGPIGGPIGSAKKVSEIEMELEKEHGAEEMMPKEKFEVSEKPEKYKKPSKKSEDVASLEVSMSAAKKKPNKEETKFVQHGGSMLQYLEPKDPEERKKYLEKIKSKKGM